MPDPRQQDHSLGEGMECRNFEISPIVLPIFAVIASI